MRWLEVSHSKEVPSQHMTRLFSLCRAVGLGQSRGAQIETELLPTLPGRRAKDEFFRKFSSGKRCGLVVRERMFHLSGMTATHTMKPASGSLAN